MKMRKICKPLLLTYILFGTGCMVETDGSFRPEIEPMTNQPVAVNTLNAYVFTLNANGFSQTRVDSLFFDTDSLVYTLTLAHYSGGDGVLTISTKDSVAILSENLNQNKVVVQTDIIGKIPKTVSIQLSDYVGSISFVLSKHVQQ